MEKLYKRGRALYIIEAGLEYLISILVADMYLASLTKELGISDSVTGILSSIISLGCLFQLLAILLNRGRAKTKVIALSIINQLLFMSLYIIPLTSLSSTTKQVTFVVAIILAYLFYNVAHPKKINWFMSLVDDEQRGRFTAKKEAVSLICGVAFNFAMGAIISYYKERDIRVAFIICGVSIFVIMLLHTLSMIFTVEKQDTPSQEPKREKLGLISALKDKSIFSVTIVFVLWQVSTSVATPFYGAYKNNTLALDPIYGISILSAIYAVARASFSFVWGRYADKFSFAKMLKICFAIAGAGFLVNAFCRPENGYVVYTIYYVLYAIAMGGINSALINLCYDYVEPQKRTDALAVSLAISGVCGFLATLAVSPLVSYIQNNNDTLFGIQIYAQQVLSIIAFLMTMLTMLYVSISLAKIKKQQEK
ncbi:MAG: MFS transporter [Clostridia bacterium]|nr:MFS transporter [Clostridia bacterium]